VDNTDQTHYSQANMFVIPNIKNAAFTYPKASRLLLARDVRPAPSTPLVTEWTQMMHWCAECGGVNFLFRALRTTQVMTLDGLVPC
jgi:hypothetical protein